MAAVVVLVVAAWWRQRDSVACRDRDITVLQERGAANRGGSVGWRQRRSEKVKEKVTNRGGRESDKPRRRRN